MPSIREGVPVLEEQQGGALQPGKHCYGMTCRTESRWSRRRHLGNHHQR